MILFLCKERSQELPELSAFLGLACQVISSSPFRCTQNSFSSLLPPPLPVHNMATTAQPNMEGIESRRLQLEESVSKLRKALNHWATWEMEYQILKEELQAADSPSPAQMVEIGRDIQGKLVNEKEVDELLGKDMPTKRTANQVIDMSGKTARASRSSSTRPRNSWKASIC